MDRYRACSRGQRNIESEIREGLKPSLSDLLDELDDLVDGLSEERHDALMMQLETEIAEEDRRNGED